MGSGDRRTVGPSERHGSALSDPSRFSAAILTPTPTDVGMISQSSLWGSLRKEKGLARLRGPSRDPNGSGSTPTGPPLVGKTDGAVLPKRDVLESGWERAPGEAMAVERRETRSARGGKIGGGVGLVNLSRNPRLDPTTIGIVGFRIRRSWPWRWRVLPLRGSFLTPPLSSLRFPVIAGPLGLTISASLPHLRNIRALTALGS